MPVARFPVLVSIIWTLLEIRQDGLGLITRRTTSVDRSGHGETLRSLVKLKISILCKGLEIENSAIEGFGPTFLEKRRAYGNQDPEDLRNIRIPQEICLSDEVVVATNIRSSSPHRLSCQNDEFYVSETDGKLVRVLFPRRPAFYDRPLSAEMKVAQVATLYGGHSLAFFAQGSCGIGRSVETACHFCSLISNRRLGTDHVETVTAQMLFEALSIALSETPCSLSQVMINGGTSRDFDASFEYYVQLIQAARKAIDKSRRDIKLHLITFPPRHLGLIRKLKGLGVSVAMNLEVFDPAMFAKYCPGKATLCGQSHILAALDQAVSILGSGQVYTIIVGGLESADSLGCGMQKVAARGITPIINVLHRDPDTPLAGHAELNTHHVWMMGELLQEVFKKYEYSPFYEKCGRNSLDTEAHLGVF